MSYNSGSGANGSVLFPPTTAGTQFSAVSYTSVPVWSSSNTPFAGYGSSIQFQGNTVGTTSYSWTSDRGINSATTFSFSIYYKGGPPGVDMPLFAVQGTPFPTNGLAMLMVGVNSLGAMLVYGNSNTPAYTGTTVFATNAWVRFDVYGSLAAGSTTAQVGVRVVNAAGTVVSSITLATLAVRPSGSTSAFSEVDMGILVQKTTPAFQLAYPRLAPGFGAAFLDGTAATKAQLQVVPSDTGKPSTAVTALSYVYTGSQIMNAANSYSMQATVATIPATQTRTLVCLISGVGDVDRIIITDNTGTTRAWTTRITSSGVTADLRTVLYVLNLTSADSGQLMTISSTVASNMIGLVSIITGLSNSFTIINPYHGTTSALTTTQGTQAATLDTAGLQGKIVFLAALSDPALGYLTAFPAPPFNTSINLSIQGTSTANKNVKLVQASAVSTGNVGNNWVDAGGVTTYYDQWLLMANTLNKLSALAKVTASLLAASSSAVKGAAKAGVGIVVFSVSIPQRTASHNPRVNLLGNNVAPGYRVSASLGLRTGGTGTDNPGGALNERVALKGTVNFVARRGVGVGLTATVPAPRLTVSLGVTVMAETTPFPVRLHLDDYTLEPIAEEMQLWPIADFELAP